MKSKHKYFEMGENESKQFSCFVCSERSNEKGIPLLQSQTAFSRISLGEKLQEILGTKYVVLVTSRDYICWDCASYINWVDRCEHKVDLVKEYIVNQVSSKYRKIEVALREKAEIAEQIPETVANKKSDILPLPIAVNQPVERKEVKEDPLPKPRRKKEYSCKYCGKDYVSLMSLSMHIQRLHGGKEVCDECGARYETLAQLKRHMKAHVPVDKQLTCVSCGFHTKNTEVYCRHVCNSSIVSLTCISCNKRYVDSNFKQESSSGSYQCQSCLSEEVSRLQQDQSSQEENPGAELATEMPEFFKDPENNNEERNARKNEEECVSFLRCEGCEEQFKLGDLTKHLCFIRGDTVEFVEVEAPSLHGKKNQSTSDCLYCKDCGDQFMNIEVLRNHWDISGHSRQVSTTNVVEINKIKDKFKKTEATFKVVKQNFNIRAVIPGQNEEALRSADDYKDMFVKVSSSSDAIEDFVKKDGKECTTCGIIFASSELLEEHQRMDCLTCITCSVSFYDNKLLKRHYLYTGHANKIIQTPDIIFESRGPMGFKCHRCVKTFQSRFLLKKHFQVHYKGTEKGACQFCLREFENKNDIQQHVLEVHGAHLYKCSYCDRTFMSEPFRNRHEAKHKGPFECQICDVKFISQKSLLLHNETYHQEEGDSCRLCGKVVEDLLALRKHERRHYFEKELDCDVCKKRFRSKALLIAHLKVHGDKIKAKCDVCQLGFVTEEALKEHKFSHMKPGRFKCPRCNASFASKAHFWMHTKTHEACYVCTVCNRSFRDTSLLAVHRKKHWRVRPYQCPHCPRTFSVPATLRRHLHVHTRIYPHKCGLCKRGFLTRHAYHRHTETVHGVSHSFPQRRHNIPSLPLNATDEDIFQAADTLIADDTLMFNDYQNKEMDQVSSTDLITNEVVVETTELFDEILH